MLLWVGRSHWIVSEIAGVGVTMMIAMMMVMMMMMMIITKIAKDTKLTKEKLIMVIKMMNM